MKAKVVYLGLDVDDKSFHGAYLSAESCEVGEFKCRPTLKGLVRALGKVGELFPEHDLRLCYEASYLGFSLQRDLTRVGIHCDVIAPNSVPRVGGNVIKTDRIDAKKMSQFYANNQLTIVSVPNEEMEKDRDLMRSRQFILKQHSELRCYLQSLLRRNGLNYKQETKNRSHWTKAHFEWIEKMAESQGGSLGSNLRLLLNQLNDFKRILKGYDEHVDELATSKKYSKKVKALICYKGIKNIFAMTMVTEIGDINRFTHPRSLVSYMGLDIRVFFRRSSS